VPLPEHPAPGERTPSWSEGFFPDPNRKEAAVAVYAVEGTVTLYTNIEPEGSLDSTAPHFEDTSSWYGEEVRFEGSFTFAVSASSEEEATTLAERYVEDMSFNSYGIEWEIEDARIERIDREEMTLEVAIGAIHEFLESFENDDIREAVSVILDAFESRNTRLTEARERITGLEAKVSELETAVATANGLRAVAEDALVAATETPFVAGEEPTA